MLKKCNINALNINGQHIARSDKVKYLGGFLDSTLSFCQHVIAKCHAANINLQKIRHIRKFLIKGTYQQLVQSLVMSHLDYANAILSGIPKTLINMSHLVYCFLHATGCRVKLKAKTETEHRWI